MYVELKYGFYADLNDWNNMKIFYLIVISLVVVTSLFSKYSEILVVSDDSYPPYIYRDDKGHLQGIIVDQWALWEQKTGVKVTLRATDWAEAQQIMADGRADVIDTMFKTQERMLRYDFTSSYASLDVPVFFHKNISGITDIASLRGFTIGVKEGDACIDVLKKNGIDTVKVYPNYEKIVQDASERRIHVFCVDKPPALFYLYKYKMDEDYRYSMNLYTGYFHRAVKKGNKELLALIEKGFSDITAEEYKKIQDKWMGYSVKNTYVAKYVLYILFGAVLITLVFLLYTFMLRALIRKKTYELSKTLVKLRQSEAHVSMILGALPDIYFLIAKDGLLMEYHSPTDSILAIPPDQFLGKRLNEIALPFEVSQNFSMNVTKALDEKQIYTYEYSLNVPIGKRFFEARFLPYDPTTALVICRDLTEQKNIETVVQDSKELYELIIDNLNDGFFDWNIIENTFYFSPQWREILGYSLEEWEQHIHEDDRERVFSMIDDHLKGRLPMVFIEYRIAIPNSSYKWILGRARVVKYNNLGKPVRMVGTMTDITESKRIEGALRESEERFRELADLLPQTVYECDKNGRVTFVNKCAYDLFGYTEEAVKNGISVIEVIDPKDRARAVANIENVMKGNLNFANEYTAVDAHGRQFPVAIYSVPIMRNGDLVGLRGLIIDITERIKHENLLQNTKDFLKTIINSVQSAIISADMDGNVTEMNVAAEVMMLAHTQKHSTGALWESFPCLKQFKKEFKRVVQDKTTEICSCSFSEDRNKRYYRISMYPLTFEGNPGAVVRIDDVTESEKKDEQLRQSQKMETIGTLAGGLAHDFNNQLGGIIGSISLIQLLLRSEIDKPKLEKYIQVIDESARRASEMVQHLLALSRKNDPVISVVNMNTVIEHVMKICSTTFDKSVDLKMKLYDGEPLVYADHSQMEQVFLNLSVNALHAMTMMRSDGTIGGEMVVSIEKASEGDITIGDHPNDGYFKVAVSDNGVGIAHDLLDKIFDPFFTTKERDKGTGLGLTMVYSIITQHKGQIFVDSEEGKGTIISVYLPAAPKDSKHEAVKEKLIKRGSGTIMVVDDEYVMRQTAKSMLEESGYTVLAAESGEAAIELYKHDHTTIDAVLLDLSMPRMSGKETFSALKEINEDIRVIMVSGYKKDVRVDESLALGVAGFLQKPFSIEVLSETIYSVIHREVL